MLLFKHKRVWAALLLPASWLLANLAGQYPRLVEAFFSRGVYPVLAGVFGRLSAVLPFSLAEILLLALAVAVPAATARLVCKLVREPERRHERLASAAANLLCMAGVVYALFTFLCGFGYHRLTFAEQSGLDIRPSSAGELAALSRELALSANELRAQVAQSEETGTMKLSFGDIFEAGRFAGDAYAGLGEEYPMLRGYTPRAKPVLFSRVMSHLDISGIYIPFTFEANVNTDMPDYNLPATMMHELSHYHGYMREDEANFLAYLACMRSGHPDFMYSGVMLAMVHTTNALYEADSGAYWEVMAELSPGVRADLMENSSYWQQFKGLVSEAAGKVNDAYLRINSQTAGVKSYGAMVDLLLANYRAQGAPRPEQ